MKKKLLILLIVLGVIQAILWSFNLLRFYKNQTVANEPNLKEGAKVVWSGLVTPEPLDFICFKVKDDYLGDYEALMRLVGFPNEVLEIRGGDLYVNNIFIDKDLDLRRLYKCDTRYFLEKLEPLIRNDQHYFYPLSDDTTAVSLDDLYYKISKAQLTRHILSKDEVDTSIRKVYNRNWNMDHFGPIKVPENKYFVIGDNRGNSLDSRYLGFIAKDDVLGTVIYKTN